MTYQAEDAAEPRQASDRHLEEGVRRSSGPADVDKTHARSHVWVPAARTVCVVLAVVLLGVASASRTPAQQCSNGVVEIGEECDDGGTCIGGANAGAACVSESTCIGNGVCLGGIHSGAACADSTTCSGGACVHCVPRGGDGCAANCTFERDVPFPMVPGELDGLDVVPGTSGVAIGSDFLSIPLPLGGICTGGPRVHQSCTIHADCPLAACMLAQQVLTVGKETNGMIPVVIKAASVVFPGIPVFTLLCGCSFGIDAKTCGGTLFESDGVTLSPNCTPGFVSGDPCSGKPPCTSVHGAGNTAAGVIGCDGLDGINMSYEVDSGGASGPCAPPNACQGVVHLSGRGGPGSARIAQSMGITVALGSCTGSDPYTYGPDGVFCTPDDPPSGIISVAGTVPAVTGTATAVVHNANGSDGSDLGPVTTAGAPFSCSALALDSVSGAGLVGAFTFVHLDTIGDSATTIQLFGSVGFCADGVLDPGEACDDHNHTDGDGCNSACQIEPCFTCSGSPSACAPDGAGTTCPAAGPCLVGTCDATATCVQTAAPDDTSCDNGVFCDGADRCSNGTCSVSDGDPCAGAGEPCNEGAQICVECRDTCLTGPPLVPACSPCAAQICTGDPYCCNAFWDEICVNETSSICQLPCGPCGNGQLDPGEECDDGNILNGDGCSSACLHEVGHFQCYAGRVLEAQSPPATVTLTDALTSFTAQVRGLRDLCTPTNKNGEDSAATSRPDHLEAYAIAPTRPRQLRQVLPIRNQQVVTQFGLLRLDLMWPNRLLVPTAKSLTQRPSAPASPAVDHFLCYRVKRSKGQSRFLPIPNVTVEDQFGVGVVTLGRPTRLCLPVNKNNEAPAAEHNYHRLLCHRIIGRFPPIGRVYTNNQFGPGVFYPHSRDELCFPTL